ncbi:MAG: P27 family phage terminase small subunit [Actinomycetota bacterium]|nr:P27 family phage terminase small subunit [Actinomycetota bacterium]
MEWNWLARATVETGVLCGCDLRALALLAETLATETTLRTTIAAEGMTIPGAGGNLKQHPALAALGSCQSRAARMLETFGLTPISRQSVDVRPPPAEPNPFAEFGGCGT